MQAYYAFKIAHYNYMLWSNAPEFCLLCSIYGPHVKYYALQIQHFIALILLVLCLHLIGKAFSGKLNQSIRESLSSTFQLLALSVIMISRMKFYELLGGIYIVATS